MTDADDDFAELFDREYPAVVAALVPIVGAGEAESVAQEAFVKALRRWSRLRRYDRPGAWVRRVAIRDAVRVASRHRRQGPLGDHPAAEGAAITDRLELDRALQALSPRQRAVVTLHHLLGWPTADIADALGCSESTVRVHLHRGRQALAVLLDDPSDHITVPEDHR